MLPKNFFENFFQGKQNNILFVCMPFNSSLDNVFEKIKKVAISLGEEYGFKDAIRTDEEWAMGDLTEEIFNGIAHSKTLLIDLSDDPKSLCQYTKEVNSNVMYELGVTLTFRAKEDILLIRKKSERSIKDLPFDINHLKINEYDNLTEEWLKEKLINCLQNQKRYKKRVLSGIIRAVDDIGFFIIKKFNPVFNKENISGRHPNFNVPEVYILLLQSQTSAAIKPSIEEIRNSVLRLLDLGIIRSEAQIKQEGSNEILEYSYHWTELGGKIAEYMGEEMGTGEYL